MNSHPLLSVEELSIGFAGINGRFTPAVNSINFTIAPGETLAIVGESGSGKTLTALSILQLLPNNASVSAASRIHFQGRDLLNCSEQVMRKIRGRKINLVFQDALSALNPVLTIGYQIKESLRLHSPLNRTERHQRAVELLDEVGIPHPAQCLKRYPHQLSGGMKQRAVIAMALATKPLLLIADEPTTALDVTVQAQVLQLLKSLQQRYKMGLLFISHDLGVVAEVADRLAVMRNGEIVEHKSAADFFKAPEHAYSQQLFNAIPKLTDITHRHSENKHPPLLEVSNLSVQFTRGVTVVDKVSLALKPGQTLALVGESGSGKTTTGKAILRLINRQGGVINFNGMALEHYSRKAKKALRREIQVIFQDPLASMNPRMTVAQLLEEGMRIHGIGNNHAERQDQIDTLLAAVDLPATCKSRYPHEFSGGQRQRICIARALALKPKLIICDEPTSALDVCVQAQILTLLKKLQQTQNIAYLLITHDFGVVAQLAHHIAVMYHGRVVEYGATEAILTTPQHSYTQKLLAAVPHY